MAKSGVFLHREDITPELVSKLKELDKIAHARNQSLAQMSLSWLLAKDSVTSVIAGASSSSQLIDSLKAIDNIEFSATELHEIDKIIGIV